MIIFLYLCIPKKEVYMEIDKSKPIIVKSHDVTLDAEYAEWIAEVNWNL
jgi:hypothetical protein